MLTKAFLLAQPLEGGDMTKFKLSASILFVPAAQNNLNVHVPAGKHTVTVEILTHKQQSKVTRLEHFDDDVGQLKDVYSLSKDSLFTNCLYNCISFQLCLIQVYK